jgi:hypothetical protein
MAKSKTTKKTIDNPDVEKKPQTEPEHIVQEKEVKKDSRSNFVLGRIFWGGLLVILGALFLLNNLGVIEARIGDIFDLWPLALIVVGVSILSLGSRLARILSLVFVLLLLVLIAFVGAGGLSNFAVSERVSNSIVEQADSESAEVSIKAGAGTVDIAGAEQDNLVEASLKSSGTELSKTSRVVDGVQRVSLETQAPSGWWLYGSRVNELEVFLNAGVPLNVSIDAGAARLDGDFEDVQLETFRLKIGAADAKLRFGSLVENLKIEIDAGVSNVVLQVPESSGVRLKLDGGLMSNRDQRGFVDKGDNVSETDNYTEAEKKIEIIANVGVSNLQISRY